MTNLIKVIFLDRDGTINRPPTKDYIYSPKEIKLLPGVSEAVAIFKELGYKVFVVSNQSCVTKGLVSKKELALITREVELQLHEKMGVIPDHWFYCIHNPEDNCECRKPKDGLIRNARFQYKIDMKNSYMVGDSKCDIELGLKVGLQTILVQTGKLVEYPNPKVKVFLTLFDFASSLL